METPQSHSTDPIINQPASAPAPVPQPAAPIASAASKSPWVPISILIAGLLIAGAIIGTELYTANRQASNNTVAGVATTTTQAVAVDITKVTVAGEPYLGNQNAPVTIAYWSDYQCPYCKQFELSTLPQIITNYVDKGEVKVVFKDFPFLGQDSTIDALAARAVWALYPQQFFAWREAMFNAQDEEGDQGFGDEASVMALTAKIPGVDATKVSNYVAANQTALQQQITADYTEGQSFGINGTPTFIIGTHSLSGALPYSNFSTLIDAELGQSAK